MRTPTRRFALALLVSIAPATLPQLALAQQRVFAQAAADPDRRRRPRALQRRRRVLRQGGSSRTLELRSSRRTRCTKHPAVLINLAQSSLRSGHTLDAARDFARYMHDSTNLTPAQRAEAEKGLAEARLKLGRIDVSAPAGTTVTIDGDLAGTDGSTTWTWSRGRTP